MSQSLNKITLMGSVPKAPEIIIVNGKEIATFSMVTSEAWKDKNTGQYKSKSEWHNIVVWNEHAVNIAKKYILNNVRVYIEGTLHYKKWQDKNGIEKISAEIAIQPFSGLIIVLDRHTENEKEDPTTPEEENTDNSSIILF